MLLIKQIDRHAFFMMFAKGRDQKKREAMMHADFGQVAPDAKIREHRSDDLDDLVHAITNPALNPRHDARSKIVEPGLKLLAAHRRGQRWQFDLHRSDG